MAKHPAPTRADHLSFCTTERWTEVRRATGGTVRHHLTFELALPSGSILRTRISRPPNREGYGRSMFAAILRDQLQVSEDAFWACVRDGVLPARGAREVPMEALPADIVTLLRSRGGLAETEIARLTRAEAIERVRRLWDT